MLVILSDLHFVDGTAGDHNVRAEAFDLFLDEIAALAEDRRATEIVLLFLGDIFDLIRTEKWLEVELADRPWGDPHVHADPRTLTPACRAKILEIVDLIGARAKEQLDLLSGRGDSETQARLRRLGVPIRRLYVPGNHDRLYGLDDRVKARIQALLGVDPTPGGGAFAHHYLDRDYGVLARHGHEFDVWNFGGQIPDLSPGSYGIAEADYHKVPIGDPITTELVARLPWAVRRALAKEGLDPLIVDGVYRRLQDIENVRPLHATIQWIYYSALQMKEREPWPPAVAVKVTEAIEAQLPELYGQFMALPFVGEWLREHDSWLNALDEADKLQALGRLLDRRPRLATIEFFLGAFEKLGLIREDSPQHDAAVREPLLGESGSGVHYVAYGHTHRHEQRPLRVVLEQEKVYFNSGTWRPRFVRTESRRDFVDWKEMSYLVFYHGGEHLGELPPGSKGISFETWSGTLLKRRRR